jgi:predicted nucleic acid-binding Zn ribbon protein
MRKAQPQPIGDVLKNVVEGLSQTKKKDIARISLRWPAFAGKKFASKTRPVHLRRGTLLVNAFDSAWLYQATLEKEKILRRLQGSLGREKIQRIQFRIGKTG